MKFGQDLLVFGLLVAGAAYAIATQIGVDPVPATPTAALPPIGTQVAEFRGTDVKGRPRTLSEWRGTQATVLYFWSLECPCVEAVERRMKEVIARYVTDDASDARVRFIAVDSHPDESGDAVFRKMGKMHAPYRMLLDPAQDVARAVGATQATEIVILDAENRIRYRGAIDDDLVKPKTPFLAPALDDVIAGRRPAREESKPYGCPFPGFEGLCPLE